MLSARHPYRYAARSKLSRTREISQHVGAYGQGAVLNIILPRMVFKGNFDRVSFALKLARKDLGLATELGRECNVPMAFANAVEQDILEAMAHDLAEKDMTTAFTIQEDPPASK